MNTTGKVLAILGFSLWTVGSIVPFAIIGESWGMTWFELNRPVAPIIKASGMFDRWYPVLLVTFATLTNALIVGFVFWLSWWLVSGRKYRGKP